MITTTVYIYIYKNLIWSKVIMNNKSLQSINTETQRRVYGQFIKLYESKE